MTRIFLLFVWMVTACMPTLAESQPAAVISLPYGEHAILVEKQTQRFYVYQNDPESSQFIRVLETDCSTGEVFGPKEKEGDKKTPEGIYFLIDEHEERDLTPIYGSKAFPTDYPHLLDRQQGKTGYAIWIHGTDKPLKPMDSNGCIALENRDVTRLSDYVTRFVTPVIIQETIQHASPEALAAWETAVTRFLDKWVRIQMTGTAGEYGALHLPGAYPARSDWEAWDRQRQLAAASGKPLQARTSRTGIYRFNDTLVVALDFSLIQGQEYLVLGRRKLFLQAKVPEALWIAADEFQDLAQPRPSLAILVTGAVQLQDSR